MFNRTTLLLTALALACVLVVPFLPEHVTGPWGPKRSVRFFHENYDMSCYFRGGAWLPLGKRPYAEVFSEYPQLATYLFGVTHVLADSGRRPDLPPGPVDASVMEKLPWASADAFQRYLLFHGVLMLPFYVVLLVGVRGLARSLGVDRPWIWVFALPGALFCTINRYDIAPAALTTLAISRIVRDRPYSGFVCLALAALTKWYPIVLIPTLVAYCWRRGRRPPLGPLAVSGLVAALVLGHSLWWSGWDGLLAPYRFHLGRGANMESLYFLFAHYVMGLPGADALAGPGVLRWTFAALQFSGLVVGVALRPAEPRRLVGACALALILFVVFAKFYSPQWFLWIAPLICALAGGWRLRGLLVAMDLATYAFYPVVFDLTWPHNPAAPASAFVLAVVVNLLIKLTIGVMLLREWRSRPAGGVSPDTGR